MSFVLTIRVVTVWLFQDPQLVMEISLAVTNVTDTTELLITYYDEEGTKFYLDRVGNSVFENIDASSPEAAASVCAHII